MAEPIIIIREGSLTIEVYHGQEKPVFSRTLEGIPFTADSELEIEGMKYKPKLNPKYGDKKCIELKIVNPNPK